MLEHSIKIVNLLDIIGAILLMIGYILAGNSTKYRSLGWFISGLGFGNLLYLLVVIHRDMTGLILLSGFVMIITYLNGIRNL